MARRCIAQSSRPGGGVNEVGIVSVQDATAGTVEFEADGTILFTPDAGFSGPASFTYTISDGEFSDTATVSIDVISTNTAPVVATPLEDRSSPEDTAVLFALPAGAFSDVDGDVLTLSAVLADGSALPSWLSFDAATGSFSGTPPQDFNGSFNIEVTASDGSLTASDTFTLNITPVNDAPVVATPLEDRSSPEDTAVLFALPAGAFSDVDGDVLTLSAVLADGSALPSWLSFDAATGSFSGTPPQDFNGSFNIEVTASDGSLTASDTFTLNITPVNDAPVAVDDDAGVTASGQDIIISASTLLANDTDIDGDPLSLVSVQDANGGSVEIDGNGNVRFTAATGYIGAASFTYTITDGMATSTAAVSLMVESSDPCEVALRVFDKVDTANVVDTPTANGTLVGTAGERLVGCTVRLATFRRWRRI